MPVLFIHVTNSRFCAQDDGANYDRPEDALASGVRGALGLLTDEINGGEPNAAIDVGICGEDGKQILRSIVSISVSALQLKQNEGLDRAAF
jgi:hypothetical protein